MIVAGGLSGGITSSIAGGKFIDGFKQGLITSGLNHVAHLVADGGIEVDKATRKQFRALVKNKDYQGAFDLVNSKYSLDADVKGKYTIGFPENQKTPGLTIGEDYGIQSVTISRDVFSNSVGTFARIVHHEFVHVFLNVFLGSTNHLDMYQVREFIAYHDMVFNNNLPKAPFSEMEGYWNKAKEFYNFMTENPTIRSIYQKQYNDYSNSSFFNK